MSTDSVCALMARQGVPRAGEAGMHVKLVKRFQCFKNQDHRFHTIRTASTLHESLILQTSIPACLHHLCYTVTIHPDFESYLLHIGKMAAVLVTARTCTLAANRNRFFDWRFNGLAAGVMCSLSSQCDRMPLTHPSVFRRKQTSQNANHDE